MEPAQLSDQLTVVEAGKLTAADVFGSGRVDALIEGIRAEAMSLYEPLNTSTEEGRTEAKRIARRVSSSKVFLDGLGKDLVADLKRQSGAIDAERKRLRDASDALRDELLAPVKAHEELEAARKQRHEEALTKIKELGSSTGTSAEIKKSILSVAAIEIGPEWEEYEPAAASARTDALAALRDRLVVVEAQEAKDRELAEMKERLAAQEKAAEAERIRAEERARAEREKILAEERAREAEKRAEEAEARAAAKAKEAAEREAREKEAEAAKRAADIEHRRKIQREARAGLMEAGIGEEAALIAVAAIADGRVPNVTINF